MRGQIGRYAVAAAVAFVLLFGLLLLVRPLIYTVAPPRDDTNYVIASAASIPVATPIVKDLLLNIPHGLLGERRSGEHAAITVIVSRSLSGVISVVNDWSPVSGCALTARTDRLTDCHGHAWTLAGDPLAAGDRPLQAFPVTNRDGDLVVDFTRPVDAGR